MLRYFPFSISWHSVQQLLLERNCFFALFFCFFAFSTIALGKKLLITAAEIFQNILQNILQRNLSDIRVVTNIADDIIIHGKTRKLHNEPLENCLKRLAHLNLKAKPEKCKFLQKEIHFYDLILTDNGTRPDPGRIENLVKASPPKNAREVRSFLGSVNSCHDYVPDYAVVTARLRELTKKNHTFNWNNTHQRALAQIKKKLTQAPTMAC